MPIIPAMLLVMLITHATPAVGQVEPAPVKQDDEAARPKVSTQDGNGDAGKNAEKPLKPPVTVDVPEGVKKAKSLVPQAMRDRELIIGTRHAPPFSIKDAEGVWSGASIELWQEIAQRLSLRYSFRELSLEDLLKATEKGEVDVSVAAITVTADRENRLDFTHPFYTTGLAMVTKPREGRGWWAVISSFFSMRFLQAIGALAMVLFLVGIAVWLFERKKNKAQFGGGTTKGLLSAFWFAAVTMTTVGYGDKAPTTSGGRLVSLVWMFAAIIIISAFTAAIASSLTVEQLESHRSSMDLLRQMRVGVIEGSTSEANLKRRGLRPRGFDSLDTAIQAILDGKLDAVVHDAPILNAKVQERFPGQLELVLPTFDRQDYAMGLPEGSPLREPVNRVIVEAIRGERWRQTLQRYAVSRQSE